MKCCAIKGAAGLAALLFLLSPQTNACAFHEFPPFGADWYHPTFFQILYNSGKDHKLGFLSNTSHFSRTFYVVPDIAGEAAHDQLLKEQIMHKTFFYQFRPFPHFICRASITQTNVDADAASDDGVIHISSAAFNQLSLFMGYDLLLLNREHLKLRVQSVVGLNTNLWSSRIFYSKIAWLKYEWSKFSPRLQAGNFSYAWQSGLSASLEQKNLRVYASLSTRLFAVNSEGYRYGREINTFLITGYHLPFVRKNFSFEPQAGLLFEKAQYDSKRAYLDKDEDVFAGGKALALQAGAIFSIRNAVQIGGHYFFAFTNKGFTEFQLYNTSRTQLFLQYTF